jgi:hypothetical protein
VSLPPHADVLAVSGVPYYSQWESPELVPRFLDGSLSAADVRCVAVDLHAVHAVQGERN